MCILQMNYKDVNFGRHDCLGKTNKSGLVKRLCVVEISPKSADTIIVVFDTSDIRRASEAAQRYKWRGGKG